MAYTDLNRLLSFAAPRSFERIKSDYPEDPEFFSILRKMGDNGITGPTPKKPELKLDLLRTGEETSRLQIDSLIAVVRKKMRFSFYIRHFGTFATVVASAVIAYLALRGQPKAKITFITALVAALSSLAANFADIIVKSPSGIDLASPDEYAKLISARLEVERIRQTLARLSIGASSTTDLDTLLDALDELSREILRYSLT